MSYFTSSTLHGGLLEMILRHLGIFLSFLRGTNAQSIQASIQKLPLPHKSCPNDQMGLTLETLNEGPNIEVNFLALCVACALMEAEQDSASTVRNTTLGTAHLYLS